MKNKENNGTEEIGIVAPTPAFGENHGQAASPYRFLMIEIFILTLW